jgi:hypothetical protein
MESGVYQLTFKDGASYVGKSINIPRRWNEHRDKFLKGTAAKNMQDRYNRFGFPDGRVLFECHGDHIDLMESYFIGVLQPVLNATPGIKIYQHEIPIFEQNPDLLKLPTSAHISMINELKQSVEIASDKIERLIGEKAELRDLMQTESLKTKLGQDLAEAYAQMEAMGDEMDEHIENLKQETQEALDEVERWKEIANRSWWRKLIG